jgi:hypothetical protein
VKVTPEARILVPFGSLKVVDIPHLGDQLGIRGGVVGPRSPPWAVSGEVDLKGDLLLLPLLLLWLLGDSIMSELS